MTERQKIEVRHLEIDDYLQLKNSMIKAYSNWEDTHWKEEHICSLLERFPEGQLCVVVNGQVVGSALALIVDYPKYGDEHTYMQITGDYTFDTHDPDGDYLYGIDVFIQPDFRGMRLARRMYEKRRELCESLNLKGIIAGGRIPKYNEYSDKMSPQEYIQKVRKKEIYDPVMTFQMSNDFHVKKILTNYMPGDAESKAYATLLEWINIYYTANEKVINKPKTIVRLGLVQWQMRHYANLEHFYEQMEFFVDAVSSYQSDFLLFPEFFNAPLMAQFNDMNEAQAIRKLAEFTLPIREKCSQYSVSYNVNIITGSMPLVEDGNLMNVGYLCRRDGTVERYEKLHITPGEAASWGMVGGTSLKSFETDAGRIGVLICYDVEFPEVARLLADEGIQILFVPFMTDTQNGYTRVRHCAQARAIENECYVAIAGCVGNLPRVHNMDIQYAQSAVLTPSDFSFPTSGIKSEATPNTEMTLIADVDFEVLQELHSHGSVRNLLDRRKDLYSLKLNKISK